MLRKILVGLSLLLAALPALAMRPQRDTLTLHLEDSLTNEYLDTVNLNRRFVINDYHLVGVQYGVSLSRMLFNPVKNETFLFQPVNYGVTFTQYGKMFGYMPYFGYQVGLFYGRLGYSTKANKDGVRPVVDGAETAVYEYIEAPAMGHMHVDVGVFKLMANLGLFAGYRFSVHRTISEGWENYTFNVTDSYKPAAPEDSKYGKDFPIQNYTDKFYPFENKFDYGVKGGVGFALMFDPVEIHVTAQARWSMSSLYQQNYYSEYYYRFANPLDLIISVGLHFQLTKRTGKTSAQLREEARRLVYPEQYKNSTVEVRYENKSSDSR